MPSEKRVSTESDPTRGVSSRRWKGLFLGFCILALALLWLPNWRGGPTMGQTVPRTPPPTFTATPSVTPLVTSTFTPLPTATATYLPGTPTPTPQPDPEIRLSVAPAVAGPGDEIVVNVALSNRGNAAATGARLSLDIPTPLEGRDVSATKGESTLTALTWTVDVGSLAPDESVSASLRLTVPADASPDQSLALQALFDHERGSRSSNVASVLLPPAFLPATGD